MAFEEMTPNTSRTSVATPLHKTPKRLGANSIKNYIKSTPNPEVMNRWQKPPKPPKH